MSAGKVRFKLDPSGEGGDKTPGPITRLRSSVRRRVLVSSSSSSSEDEDIISKSKAKNNLTLKNVKSIIKNVVSNDQLLEVCEMQVKEQERAKQEEKDKFKKQLLCDPPSGTKLTRLKAKELNQSILPLVDLKAPEIDQEVLSELIKADFREEDDDDEEYYPGGEDEYHSDDYSTATYSDVESQPRTPGEGLLSQDENLNDSGVRYDVDEGIFKIPKSPQTLKIDLSAEEDNENIAKRTRSKLCLATTDIETIEETFIPPDITSDMYDFDPEMDNAWREFLTEFQKPLATIVQDEDEETDPEYVTRPMTATDLFDICDSKIKVGKKEYDSLMAELMEALDDTILPKLTDTGQNITPEPETYDLQPTQIEPEPEIPVPETITYIDLDQQPHGSDITPSTAHNSMHFVPDHMSTPMVNSIPDPNYNYNHSYVGFPYTQPQITVPGPIPFSITSYLESNLNITGQELENELMKRRFMYEPPPIDEHAVGFTQFQIEILLQQFRMSVQLATQSYIQSYSHPYFDYLAPGPRQIIQDFEEMADGGSSTLNKICNLKEAVKVCDRWKAEMDQPSPENEELIRYLKYQEQIRDETRYFSPRMLEYMVSSTAFLYPKLLPKKAFRLTPKKRSVIFTEGELLLYSHLIYYYFKETGRKYTYKESFELCRQQYTPWRPLRSFEIHKTNLQKGKVYNALRFYWENGRPPGIQHKLELFDPNKCIQHWPKEEMPPEFGNYVYSYERERRLQKNEPVKSWRIVKKGTKRKHAIKPQSTITLDIGECRVNYDWPTEASVGNVNSVIPLEQKDSTAEEIAYEGAANLDLPILDDDVVELVAESPVEPASSPRDAFSNANNSYNYDPDNFICSIRDQQRIREVLRKEELTRKLKRRKKEEEKIKNCDRLVKYRWKKLLIRRLDEALVRLDQSYDKHVCLLNENQIGTKIFYYIKEFDIFLRLLQGTMKSVSAQAKRSKEVSQSDGRSGSGDSVDSKRIKMDDDYQGIIKEKRDMTKRQLKVQQRLQDGNRLLLAPSENAEEVLERDSLFAWNFFERVEKTYRSEGQAHKADKFLSLLTNFKPKRDSVPDLYYKMEDLFLPDHSEFAEAFLTFLLPGHAAQVGKFFEHFMASNMQTFVDKMNTYFSKQPAQLRKIYALLNELATEQDINMAMIKQKFLPLLKGNQLLIDWFLQLFPNERAPTAQDSEFEILVPNKKDADPQVGEEIPAGDIVSVEPNINSFEQPTCAIKYMQGRIHYGNRVILPADLSFLALNAVVHATEPADATHDNGQCVHAIKTKWDAKVMEESSIDGEESNALPNSIPVQPAQLCDAAALKAHSLRLNPPSGTAVEVVPASAERVDEPRLASPKKGNANANAKGVQNNCPSPTKRLSTKGGLSSTNQSCVGVKKSAGTEKRFKAKASSTLITESEPSGGDDTANKSSTGWTRDEDKLILEAINGRQVTEDKVLSNLAEAIPDRSKDELKERLSFLINLLKEFS